MLAQIEDEKAKRDAQDALERVVKKSLRKQGKRNIGFPSGNVDEVIYSNGDGELWCAFGSGEDYKIPRKWNAFGVYDADRRSQIITVEINIPVAGNSGLVSGFFAKDPTTGRVYLMHDGGVGGGRKGVGRKAFLAWSKSNLVTVAKAEGGTREGIVIGEIGGQDLPSRLWRFVRLVRDFKTAVKSGELSDRSVTRLVNEWEDFSGVGGGRRKGERTSVIDYISFHDDVVQELFRQRDARRAANQRIIANRLVDLYVRTDSKITELYEVKTKLDRHSIYTGIGQLMAHSVDAEAKVERILVIPEGTLPGGLEAALSALAIRMRRFSVSGGKNPKVSLA